MKRAFKTIILLIVAFVGIISANALTDAERKAKAAKILDDYHFHFKYVNMDDNFAMIKSIRGEEEWRSMEEWYYPLLVRGELEKVLASVNPDGMDVFCYLKGEEYQKDVEDPETHLWQTENRVAEEDMCSLYIIFGDMFTESTDFEVLETDITGVFEEVKGNASYKKEALAIAKSIQKDFYVNDRDIINHIINYKTKTATFFEGNNVTVEFNDIKHVVEANPDYEIFVGLEEVRRGDYFVGLEEGGTFIARDGIIYSFALHTYGAGTLFYVPIGTKVEDYAKVVEQRIKDYIGDDSHKIKVEKIDFVLNDGEKVLPTVNAKDTVLNVLGLKYEDYLKKYNTSLAKEKAKIEDEEEADYCDEYGCIAVPVYKLTIDDQELEIGIIEVPEDTINSNGITSSKNLATGIIIRTASSNVPLDAILDIKELELSNKEKDYLKSNGFKEVKAYDLNLFSKILDKYIEKFNTDSEILIPVSKKESNLKVVYISDDLKTIEKYNVEYVTIDDQLYMLFKTKHFSNYIVVEDTNPATGDNIMTHIIVGVLSLTGMAITFYTIKKHKKD